MEIVPFDLKRDRDLYVEGVASAFMSSYPGVSVSADVIASIEAGMRGLVGTDDTAAFTLIEGVPIGFVAVGIRVFYVIPQGYVDSIYVRPANRGVGASQLLLHAAERWSLNRGANTIALDVSLVNESAVSSYKKAGYAATRVQMEKLLTE